MPDVTPGLFAEFEKIITEIDTASYWGSKGLPVFSTPSLIGIMESAAVIALRGHLSPGQATVGGHIDVCHLATTLIPNEPKPLG
ncbi:MAG: hypothetical protein AB1531_03470 [Chloroflexota bacterium]